MFETNLILECERYLPNWWRVPLSRWRISGITAHPLFILPLLSSKNFAPNQSAYSRQTAPGTNSSDSFNLHMGVGDLVNISTCPHFWRRPGSALAHWWKHLQDEFFRLNWVAVVACVLWEGVPGQEKLWVGGCRKGPTWGGNSGFFRRICPVCWGRESLTWPHLEWTGARGSWGSSGKEQRTPPVCSPKGLRPKSGCTRPERRWRWLRRRSQNSGSWPERRFSFRAKKNRRQILPFSSFTPLATNVYKGEVDVAEGKNCFWNPARSPPHPAFMPPIKPRFSQPTKNISENEDRGHAAILRPPDDVFAKGKEVPVKDSLPVREEVGGWVRQLENCQAPNRIDTICISSFFSLFNLDICVCVSQDPF